MRVSETKRLRYLVVGHVTRDREPGGGFAPGGTVAYAGLTAQALGCEVYVVTSAGPDLDLEAALPGIRLHRIPAEATTTFENRYTEDGGRLQFISALAAPIGPQDVPADWWRAADIVHLGPVARECDPAIARLPLQGFLGLTPQGWMRRWDADGRVERVDWEEAQRLLPVADAVVLSEEDVGGEERWVADWARQTGLLALTRSAAGCTVYVDGVATGVPGWPTREVDPTGAGDIFAAVFFVELQRGRSPHQAARLANCVAARSVTRRGLQGVPTPDEIEVCRATVNG